MREASVRLILRCAHMWWVGFKVFCRWAAFSIVLAVLWLPTVALGNLLGSHVSQILAAAFFVLVAPIVFYLTSRYLLLLGDEDQAAVESKEGPTDAGGQQGYGLRKKITISTAAAFVGGLAFALSPDPFTGLVLGAAAAVLCGVSLLILSRFQFVKSASSRVQTLICVLVCLAAMLASLSLAFTLARVYG